MDLLSNKTHFFVVYWFIVNISYAYTLTHTPKQYTKRKKALLIPSSKFIYTHVYSTVYVTSIVDVLKRPT